MKKFKFNIGEQVFIIGKAGICIVIARGSMKYISGGKINLYQLDGGNRTYAMEQVLLTPVEMSRLAAEGTVSR